MSTVLTINDYRAIGRYAEQHELRLALAAYPTIHFTDSSGADVSILLSHIHSAVDDAPKDKRKRKKQ